MLDLSTATNEKTRERGGREETRQFQQCDEEKRENAELTSQKELFDSNSSVTFEERDEGGR